MLRTLRLALNCAVSSVYPRNGLHFSTDDFRALSALLDDLEVLWRFEGYLHSDLKISDKLLEKNRIFGQPLLKFPNGFGHQESTASDLVEVEEKIRLGQFAEFLSGQEVWTFWKEWYSCFLNGSPPDWELQRRIALLDDNLWDAGPKTIAAEIERIKAEILSEKLPMAETIELNPETGKFQTVPIPVENAHLMSALLSQIEDAMEDCVGSHNGLAQQSGDVKKLNRVLAKYRDDPQNAELTLTRVASSLRTQLHGSSELPDNEDNLALLNAVEEGVRGIRANHPEVAANREQLAQQAFKALSTEDKQLLENALPLLEEISAPELAEDFAADIPELINDALRPLPDGARPLPGADAATRVFSRVSKMALACEKSAKTFDSKEVKTIQLAHLGYTCLEFLYALVQVGLKALGVV